MFCLFFILPQEDAKRAAQEAHKGFAAYEGDLPTLLNIYDGYLKVSVLKVPSQRRLSRDARMLNGFYRAGHEIGLCARPLSPKPYGRGRSFIRFFLFFLRSVYSVYLLYPLLFFFFSFPLVSYVCHADNDQSWIMTPGQSVNVRQ